MGFRPGQRIKDGHRFLIPTEDTLRLERFTDLVR